MPGTPARASPWLPPKSSRWPTRPPGLPEIWVDGIRMVRSGGDPSEFLAMSTLDVEVIEVFPSASSIPPDYATSVFCMVGIWTKRGG